MRLRLRSSEVAGGSGAATRCATRRWRWRWAGAPHASSAQTRPTRGTGRGAAQGAERCSGRPPKSMQCRFSRLCPSCRALSLSSYVQIGVLVGQEAACEPHAKGLRPAENCSSGMCRLRPLLGATGQPLSDCARAGLSTAIGFLAGTLVLSIVPRCAAALRSVFS